MSLQLTIYSKDAFGEYLLPPINNSDHTILLHRDFFALAEDVSVRLEVRDLAWSYRPDETCHLSGEGNQNRTAALRGGSILHLKTAAEEDIAVFVLEKQALIAPYKKYRLANLRRLSIGRAKENDICFNNNNMVSSRHAVMMREGGGWSIENASGNGLYVNTSFVSGRCMLHYGDYINIIGLHMVFLGDELAIDDSFGQLAVNMTQSRQDAPVEASKAGEAWQTKQAQAGRTKAGTDVKTMFHRSPRNIKALNAEAIEIEEPPAQPMEDRQPLLLTIGPSMTMALPMIMGCVMMMVASRQSGTSSGLFMYSGLVMAGSSAMIGVMWSLLNLRYRSKKTAEQETHRFDAYSRYLVQKTDTIKALYDENKQILENMYPDTAVCAAYGKSSASLWNRNPGHGDYLSCRLGTGNTDFQAEIDIPKEKFSLDQDELREKPAFIKENYKTLYGVPITIDLEKNRITGVIGGIGMKGAAELARVLTVQLAAGCCYTDLKMVYLYNEETQGGIDWSFARWLPHTWSEDRKVRYVAGNKTDASDICYELAKVFRKREEEGSSFSDAGFPKPYFVFFIADLSLISNELIAKYLLEAKEEYGLSVLIFTDAYENLPNNCSFVIENDSTFRGIYSLTGDDSNRTQITFDTVSTEQTDAFARRLSNIEVQETEVGGEIPGLLTFLDMYDVHRLSELNVMNRWIKNRTYDNIRGMLGQRAGGVTCYLDVHEKYHGPHGLVAGTTGSGKSETLQTYLLSLAINYSPDDVGFFIIDYKGGGMANLFNGLPHMIGQISNLSGNQVSRAMVSIKSENQRRQRIFNASGVNNINSYTRLYKNNEVTEPVPHLFIIIDEFAELKREEPDFMRELISVAQVGRSLGVHLILATQKPSGTVDDNIWSNSKFRLCLRVQDRQDSMDMLHKPDAAYITQAGRGYLQVGNDEVYELFQSGFSGAPYVEDEAGDNEIASLISPTGRVMNTGKTSQNLHKEAAEREWVGGLTDCVLTVCRRNPSLMSRQALENSATMQTAIDEIYTQIQERAIEYPENRYNTERLREFMKLFLGAMEMGASSGAELTDLILKTAAAGGIKLPQEKEKTQLEAVKEYLGQIARANGYVRQHALWLPVLPGEIYLEEFDEYRALRYTADGWKQLVGEWQMSAVMGKIDDPQNQSQFPLVVTYPECGHIAVIGSVVSGKSTFLQTYVYSLLTSYSPAYINVYMIDFSSKLMAAFEGYPHVGGVMYDDDPEKIRRFFSMIETIERQRKQTFHGGNFSQYVKAHGPNYPAILLVIDNFSAFNEKTEQKYQDTVIRLSKEGGNLGIYLVISAAGVGMSELPGRVADNISSVYTLQMKDKYAYGDVLHTMKIEVLPENDVKGRGLVQSGARILEYQTALACRAADDFARMESIEAEGAVLTGLWKGESAKPVPSIPEKPVWTGFRQLEGTRGALAQKGLIPVGYDNDNAEVYSLNLRDIFCYVITGMPRTGRRNFLKILIRSASLKGLKTVLIDLDNAGFASVGNLPHVTWIQDYAKLLEFSVNELAPAFTERNQLKHELQAKGYDEDEIYGKMSETEPILICIAGLEAFMDSIRDSKDSMQMYFENIFAKGALHNIYFFGVMNIQNKSTLGINTAFKNFVSEQNGIHFGGNVAGGVLNFDYVPYREQAKILGVGVGMLAEQNGRHDTDKVIVPLSDREEKA